MSLERYSARLLFQFRVMVGRDPGKRRLCEDRIITFHARNAEAAYRCATRKGKDSEHDYMNADGNRVYFDFIGIAEILCLGVETEEGEVWYSIRHRLKPMERKRILIPPKERLNAFRMEGLKAKKKKKK